MWAENNGLYKKSLLPFSAIILIYISYHVTKFLPTVKYNLLTVLQEFYSQNHDNLN